MDAILADVKSQYALAYLAGIVVFSKKIPRDTLNMSVELHTPPVQWGLVEAREVHILHNQD